MMKYVLSMFFLLMLSVVPSAMGAEIWSYACAEAMTQLNEAQHDVTQKHNLVYQSKLGLRLFPNGLITCQKERRGFGGGKVYCVNHRSRGGLAIKEVIKAERQLKDATRVFALRLKNLTRACSLQK